MSDASSGAVLTDLILIRHGESLANINCSTDPNCPLSDRGFEQARELGAWLATLPLEGFVGLVSPYLRAIQTAQLISERTGLAFSTDDDIREFGPGTTIDGRHFDAESPERFAARMKAFLRRSSGRLLIVSHGSPIAYLAQLANGIEPRIDSPFHGGIGNARFRWISDPTPFSAFKSRAT